LLVLVLLWVLLLLVVVMMMLLLFRLLLLLEMWLCVVRRVPHAHGCDRVLDDEVGSYVGLGMT
jgi:hypothetical protein